VVCGECPLLHAGRAAHDVLWQGVSYSYKLCDIVRLPLPGVYGEHASTVWEVAMTRRTAKPISTSIRVLDLVELSMAPNELFVIISISGYLATPDAK
jgi:hypothetical protein